MSFQDGADQRVDWSLLGTEVRDASIAGFVVGSICAAFMWWGDKLGGAPALVFVAFSIVAFVTINVLHEFENIFGVFWEETWVGRTVPKIVEFLSKASPFIHKAVAVLRVLVTLSLNLAVGCAVIFAAFYGGWLALFVNSAVSAEPHEGWWNSYLFLASVLSTLELDNSPGRHSYQWRAAVGGIAGGTMFFLLRKANVLGSAHSITCDLILMAVFVFSGVTGWVIRTAGEKRDRPILAGMDDFASGIIGGGGVAFVLLVASARLATHQVLAKTEHALLAIGACGVLGGFVNLWRRSKVNPFLVLSTGVNRGKSLVAGIGWTAVSGVVIWASWNLPLGYLSDAAETWIRIAGAFVGFYILFASGLSEIAAGLSWSGLSADTHGQARTATAKELTQAGLMPRKPDAIYLGKFLDNGLEREEVGYPGGSPLITIGRTGSGKGMGLIVPNLSVLRRSVLIIDPKGEAAAMTARKRAKFGRVVILNPFNYLADECPWLRTDSYNPLAAIRSDKDFVSDCTVVAHSLVKQEKDGAGRFFSTSAHDLITAVIMYEIIRKEEMGGRPSLANVWSMLTEPWGGSAETGPTGVGKTIFEMATHENAALRSLAGRFVSVSNSNRDIISTAINELSFINDPEMGSNLSGKGDFRFSDLKREIVSVYLILDAKHMESHSNWLRVIVTSALNELTSTPPAKGMPPVLFMLDEFANLGHLPAISNAMNMTRGYGVQLWPFVQDLNQLKDLYRDRWENFLGARSVLTAFAPNESFTAEYLSKLCGGKTIIVESENDQSNSVAKNRSRAPQGVPLIRPEEIQAMPQEQMLCLVDPVKRPFMATAPGYWKTNFKEGLDENPYHPS